MDIEPTLPIPISYIAGSYFLFSIDAVTYLRREHHICGVLSGTLPQIPQQNVFLGLPLKLMPEEARLLVEKGVACIVDEVKVQKDGMRSLMEEDRKKYLRELESQGQHAMRLQTDRKEQQRERALKKIEEKKAAKAKKSEQPPITVVTPATSYPPLPYESSAEQRLPLPDVPASYPLFAHLHSEGYFLSPGLRFGCQYLAYPGDPLRFHSHFLGVAADWDEEFDLMKIVAGGRLGTGVKKGFLIGGAEKTRGSDGDPSSVRTFSIEWGGM
ncbi:hypothetical protein ASPCADRAFT_50486 [Aspergillus carbonarius ITEM 5010]|uniref:tRNA-splicing endonuclease subunit Sen34 n=1 Tax=Aspergillus carbonarius (strain ITEM 5010) TaxID=602072 RepID=A0A1R3RJD5_ASPC5|nr:hypothetical protein ASPCADRAFT_50486 [Aspergillus carbonarius ITEM 5010]